MCADYYDVRTFGSVLANKAGNDQVRGPVQIGIAFSIDKVLPQRIGITRIAATEAEEGKENKTMGNKWLVPYALYRANGHISAPLARKTGFSESDLELLWKALLNCFEHDRSATRGMMTARRLIVFRHDDDLGNAPAARLFERIKVGRTDDPTHPLIAYDQYGVTVDKAGIPKGVEPIELL
jgi:CRISPR-associated protein Csd2